MTENPLRSRKAEWFVTLPSFLWLALFFAIPALIVLAFTFHAHTTNGGVGEWSLSTWRELVDPDYPAIVWNTFRISFEVTFWCIVLALPCAYAIARMNKKWRAIVAGSIMLPFWTSFVVRVFAWKTMLHPDGWLQSCYITWLELREWLFDWLPAVAQRVLRSQVQRPSVHIRHGHPGLRPFPGHGNPDHAPAAAQVQDVAAHFLRQRLQQQPGAGVHFPLGKNPRVRPESQVKTPVSKRTVHWF